jgi:hypothetical protein
LEGITAEDARKRPLPMNCISWFVGHLANQENSYWCINAQGMNIAPGLNERVGYGQPASTPPLDEMWEIWRAVTTTADRYLENLTSDILQTYFIIEGKPLSESVGTKLMRNIFHYWFHTGEAHAIRQILGHTNLLDFVGDMSMAVYIPES